MEYKGRYRQSNAEKRVQQLEAELQTLQTRFDRLRRLYTVEKSANAKVQVLQNRAEQLEIQCSRWIEEYSKLQKENTDLARQVCQYSERERMALYQILDDCLRLHNGGAAISENAHGPNNHVFRLEMQLYGNELSIMTRTLNSILSQDVISREALLKALDEGLEAGKITDMVMVEQLIHSMPAANFFEE